MKLNEIDEITYRQIEVLCEKRLKRTVTPYEVLRWLSNFKAVEYSIALKVLEYLDVYTEDELINLLNERLSKLFATISIESHVIINPVAEFGKSGTLMIYYIKKTPSYLANEKRITIYATPEQIKFKKKSNQIPPNSIIALVDDFCGSGHSLLSYYRHFIKQQIEGYKKVLAVYGVCLFCLTKAASYLRGKAPELELIFEIKEMAFSSRRSVFGYREKMLPVRDFSFRYGKGLWVTQDWKGKLVDHALGYENSQALVIFPYNPPNNTLPIIWSDKNGRYPLYARNPEFKISEAKKIRQELAYYMSLLKHTEFDIEIRTGEANLPWKTVNFITKTDFHSFAILFLLRKKRAKPVIRQILGITEEDYSEKIEELQKRGMMNAKEELTAYGEEIYLEVLKQRRRQKKVSRQVQINYSIRTIDYLPKVFRGKSLLD